MYFAENWKMRDRHGMKYKRRHCSKAVKKTLSIPERMNEAAIKAGVNFSQVLQEALMAKLNIQ